MAISDDERRERYVTAEAVSRLMGQTPAYWLEQLEQGLRAAAHDAMESISDDDAPPELLAIIEPCYADTGQRITAVKRIRSGWRLIVLGNPLLAEAWLRERGYAASSTSPATIDVL